MFPIYPLNNVLSALQFIQELQPQENTISLYFNQLRIKKTIYLNDQNKLFLEKLGWIIDEEENIYCYDF